MNNHILSNMKTKKNNNHTKIVINRSYKLIGKWGISLFTLTSKRQKKVKCLQKKKSFTHYTVLQRNSKTTRGAGVEFQSVFHFFSPKVRFHLLKAKKKQSQLSHVRPSARAGYSRHQTAG